MNVRRQAVRVALAFVTATVLIMPAPAADPAAVEFFEKRIRPVLVEHCQPCHSAALKEPKGGLRLDNRSGFLAGGDGGKVVVPGEPDRSRLIEAVRYGNVDFRMPPRSKLPDGAIADLVQWVRDGAVFPGGDGVVERKSEFDVQSRRQSHWAWRPVQAVEPPAVRNPAWSTHPVDRFIAAKREARGLTAAAPAEPHTLLRRLYFDLIGLPPPPEEMQRFIAGCRAAPGSGSETGGSSGDGVPPSVLLDAVDRLLASPRFGERWARHWLDLVRYAESRGHEFDHTLPNAWQYRDYVIRALNADVPYDQWVVEHVAGDLLARPRLHPTEGFNESILGTGFWFLGEEVHSPVDVRLDQADRFDNRIDVMTKTFLGLTVACARCHDHKFDAISTQDYYALFGSLASSNYRSVRFDHWERHRKIAGELAAVREQQNAAIAQAWSKSAAPAAKRIADYLLAARDVLHNGEDETAVAARLKLEVPRLAAWVAAIRQAAKDERDPLHLWALVSPARDGKRIREIVTKWASGQQSAATPAAVVDFARAAEPFLPDDVTFGYGPVRAGAPVVVSSGDRLALRFATESAVVKDRLWDGLIAAPGTESDAGALASPNRAGRTIRTPTFTITNGKIWFRMRGTARIYAAVAQHVMIAGPLHGKLVQQVKAGPEFSWHAIDLSLYPGLPVHLEFTAEDGTNFALASVVQTNQPPKSGAAFPRFAKSLEGVESLDAIAHAIQDGFLLAVAHAGQPVASEAADFADWLSSRPDLCADPASWREQFQKLQEAEARLASQIRKESRLALAMQDGPGFDERVFIRGQPKMLGDVVPRRFLEALDGKAASKATSGRLELAQQMIDSNRNPFIARVHVNRVWHHLFGRGLVASVDNFGVLGEAPTHPELLDYLANWFVRNGWSTKKLIRLLVTTRAYQMAPQADARAAEIDPQNLLLHHARLRRLEGEAIRDSLLQLSGRLDSKMHGPPVLVHLSPFQDGRGRPASGPIDGAGRRSIYLSVRRNFLSSFLLAFDTPTPFSTMGRRTVSNVPAQALILLNDPFVHQQAEQWARRVLASSNEEEKRIAMLYLEAFGRPPTSQDQDDCREFLKRQVEVRKKSPNDPAIWADLAHVLINAKEFIFLN